MSAQREVEIERMLVKHFGIELARDHYDELVECAIRIGELIQTALETVPLDD